MAKGVSARDEETVGALMEALVIVGIAMSYVDCSRPASGSEHHLSHYFEITGILDKHEYFAHGIDVVYSGVVTAKIREYILKNTPVKKAFDRAEWEKNIKRVYTSAADGVIALQDKMNYYGRGLEKVYREKWDGIREILSEVPSVRELNEILVTAGLDFEFYNKFYGRDVIEDADLYAKDLKDRYTVLWLYFSLFR